jgi:hypothetical protein
MELYNPLKKYYLQQKQELKEKQDKEKEKDRPKERLPEKIEAELK